MTDFEWEETKEASRLTVLVSKDSNITESQIESAISDIVEDTTGEDKNDSVRSFDRGYET